MKELIEKINKTVNNVLCSGDNVSFIAMNPNTWNKLVSEKDKNAKSYSILLKENEVKYNGRIVIRSFDIKEDDVLVGCK